MSALRSYSQIGSRSKLLLVVRIPNSSQAGGPPFANFVFGYGGASINILPSGSYSAIGPVTTPAELGAIFGSTVIGSLVGSDKIGYIFKDLGRTVQVYDNTREHHLSTYRECQLVSGATTEGVGGADYGASYYVRVWEAAPFDQGPGRGFTRMVAVARTG